MSFNKMLLISSILIVLAGCTADKAEISEHKIETVASCEAPAQVAHAAGDEETPFFQPTDNATIDSLAPVLGNALARNSLSLNGEWAYIVDQANIGDSSPLLRGGVGQNVKHGVSELLEYSFTGGKTLTVPGDWNTQVPELFWYRGVVWMQREFDYQRTEGKRQFLYFGGANFKKDVYVNGQLIARHKGGFTPFNLDVSQYLVDGRNSVVVKVDSISGPDQVPTEYNDWFNYGGITREVLLVELPETFILNYKVQLKKATRDTLQGWVQLDGPKAANAQVELAIPQANVAATVKTDSTGRAHFELPIQVQLWEPDAPKRYSVSLISEEDAVSEQVGFRTIETRGEDILLNGKTVFLRGISMHEESLRKPGRAWGQADAEAAIAELKALNANYVRLAHYPHNEYMVRAADAAGIMIWAELPVYHAIDFKNPCTLEAAKQQYNEFIARDQNRAAVVMWSIANETKNTPPRNAFLGSLAKHVRATDDTRLITAAVLGEDGMRALAGAVSKKMIARHKGGDIELPPVEVVIDDPLGEVIDVIGYNQYLGWYPEAAMAQAMAPMGLTEAQIRKTMLEELPNLGTLKTAHGKPLIISEFGGGAKQGYKGEGIAVFSESYQAMLYESQLAFLARSPALKGISPWVLKDFRAPYRLNTQYQDYWNRKGIVSDEGKRKMAFDVLSKHYAERASSGE